MIDEPVVIHEFYDGIALGESEESEGVPVVGFNVISGLIHSDGHCKLTIWQGINDTGGTLQYRYPKEMEINNDSQPVEIEIFGKFVKATIENLDDAIDGIDVECFLLAKVK